MLKAIDISAYPESSHEVPNDLVATRLGVRWEGGSVSSSGMHSHDPTHCSLEATAGNLSTEASPGAAGSTIRTM